MIINCTKKLCEKLRIKPESVTADNPLFCWCANLVKLNRRNTVVLINPESRYTIVLVGMKSADFKRFDKIAIQAISDFLIYDGIDKKLVERYITDSGDTVLSKNTDRKATARLNKSCEELPLWAEYESSEALLQKQLSKKFNRNLFFKRNKDYFNSDETFYKMLEDFYGQNVIKQMAYRLKISLDFEKAKVSRELIVPASASFEQLHMYIQDAFCWQNYHLHEFEFTDSDNSHCVIATAENFDDNFEDIIQGDIKQIDESETFISAVFGNNTKITYTYDMGDNWQHIIECKEMITDYDKTYPICTNAVGEAPPEDCGGEYGYYEFIEVMKNPEHEKYDTIKKWADSVDWQRLNLDMVNFRLRY
jgi:hypothetical protein